MPTPRNALQEYNRTVGIYFNLLDPCPSSGGMRWKFGSKVCSFQEDSCANLVSFKIVVHSIQIKTKSTTILKESRFAQLSSKNEQT